MLFIIRPRVPAWPAFALALGRTQVKKPVFTTISYENRRLQYDYLQRALPHGPARACCDAAELATPRIGVSAIVWRLPETAESALIDRDWRRCARFLTALPFETAECLLVQRAKEPASGLWSFPGGRLRHGERLLEGVARELNEETGIKLSDMMLGSEYEIVEYIESDWHFVILAATGFAGHGVLPIPGDDAKRACWVSVRDLMDPSFRCTAQCSDTVKQTWSRLVRFVASEGSVTSV